VLRGIAVLAALVVAAPGLAQESLAQERLVQEKKPEGAAADIILFLKSPFYAQVDPSVTHAGAKDVDAVWCRAGTDLSTFAWAEEFALVGRGNNPIPLVHAIMTDADGKCQYFTVYTSLYAVPLDLGSKLSEWSPAIPKVAAQTSAVPTNQVAAAKPMPQPVTAVAALPTVPDTASVPPQTQSQPAEQGASVDAHSPLPRPRPQDIDLKKQDADSKKPAPVAKPKARAVALAPRPAAAAPGTTTTVRPVRAQ
jgi:hypothetical protein